MNAGHIHDELAALLRGEADRATVAEAAAHLRGCEDCYQELISALVAHASLTSAARFAPELAMLPEPEIDFGGQTDDLSAPDHRLVADPATLPDPAILPDPATLPDLGPTLARIDADSPHTNRRRHSFGARWLAAAAVLGIGVGVGGVVAADRLQTPTSHTVELAAFDKGTVPAAAEILGGEQLRVRAAALPRPGAHRLYEVWLTNDARTQMYSVGSLPAGRNGTFTVAPALLHRYTAIEVSVQPLNSSSYSGTSVLRGRYG